MTRILHVLDHSLPLHSGYTFRTRAILKSLRAAGMEVAVIPGAQSKTPRAFCIWTAMAYQSKDFSKKSEVQNPNENNA